MTVKKSYRLENFKVKTDSQGQDTGEFEAYVSVFNNVDFQGDRVLPGAFTKSLDTWVSSGDPIPISFSHDWSPWSLVGFVDPSKAVQDNKGLKVIGQLDIDTNPTAAQVYSLLKRRIVKEFSFAYDIVKETKAKDGANNLVDLNIIEVGPTLKGANDETDLVAVKHALESATTARDALEGKAGRSISESNMQKLQAAHDALYSLGAKCASSDGEAEKALDVFPTRSYKDAYSTAPAMRRHLNRGQPAGHGIPASELEHRFLPDLVAMHVQRHASGDTHVASEEPKALVMETGKGYYEAIEGSYEDAQNDISTALSAWGEAKYPAGSGDMMDAGYHVCLLATFSDHVIASVENYITDPEYFSFSYTYDEATDTVTLGDPTPVDVELTVTPAAPGKSDAEIETKETEMAEDDGTCIGCDDADGEKDITYDDNPDHFKAIDDSSWDGPAAMSKCANSDTPASCYGSICAGKRAGDPALASSHALPHHKTAGGPANKNGVANALARFDQTQGLTNSAAARAHLEAHQAEYEKSIEAGEKDYVDFNNLILEVAEAVGLKAEEIEGKASVSSPESESTEDKSTETDEPSAKDAGDEDLDKLSDAWLKAEIAAIEVAKDE